MRGTTSDPFAALDSNAPAGSVDEISSRFPSLDQFSLLHDGGKFDFDASSPTKPTNTISQRVTEKLADDAFASQAPSKVPTNAPTTTSATRPPVAAVSRAQKIISSNPELQSVSTSPSIVYQPTPTRPQNTSYVSQGTMTTPTPPPTGQPPVKYAPSPVYRFPPASSHHRSASLPRNQDATPMPQLLRPEENQSLHSNSLPRNPSRPSHLRHPSSSRPSLEGGRPIDIQDPITRTKSSNARPRPASTYLESNMDYLREKETSGRPSMEKRNSFAKPGESAVGDQESDEETNIASNVEFLRTMEDHDSSKKDRRRSSGANNKSKRSSLPSLSGTKNLLAGKFGDAFKRFESNTAPPGPRTPSPLHDLERRDLTPIAGSEATDGRSDDGNVLEDADNMAPEQRRELERRRLSMEEKRVANAAAEYRRRLADRGPSTTAPRSIGGVTRAASIQNKVKTLLDENQQSPPKKTAQGYGRFTASAAPPTDQAYTRPVIARKPIVPSQSQTQPHPPIPDLPLTYPKPRPQIPPSKTGGPRPNAPPKPTHLNSISTGPQSVPPPRLQARAGPGPEMSPQEKEDYIADFSKRFPSLSGIELVETDVGGGGGVGSGGDGRGGKEF